MIFHTPFYITTLPRREKSCKFFCAVFSQPSQIPVITKSSVYAQIKHISDTDRQTETEEQSQTDRDRRAISDRQTETEEQSQ